MQQGLVVQENLVVQQELTSFFSSFSGSNSASPGGFTLWSSASSSLEHRGDGGIRVRTPVCLSYCLTACLPASQTHLSPRSLRALRLCRSIRLVLLRLFFQE